MIIILGPTGQLGTAIARALPEAILIPRQLLNLSNPEVIEDALSAITPSAIINCAAWTDVDAAERNTEAAWTLNARAPEAVAAYSARTGCRFITISTDYVFDGTESQPYDESRSVNPINVYCRTKVEGEHLVLSTYPEALIVRIPLLISATHENYLWRHRSYGTSRPQAWKPPSPWRSSVRAPSPWPDSRSMIALGRIACVRWHCSGWAR